MKKALYFAAAAALFSACSSELLDDQAAVQQEANGTAVNFSVYTPRSVTRAGLDSTITTNSLKTGYHSKAGFGVFAYYTPGEVYDVKATPNFMYNQQVTWNGSKWAYEPVKYWPNEFGNNAVSDDVDRVSFFAYAPFIEVDPTTGAPKVPDTLTAADAIEKFQTKNITKITKNTAQGDPLVYYTVDVDPATSVDLLWGVAASDTVAGPYYTAINPQANVRINPGKPFIDLIKPNDAVNDKLSFNLRHALAKMKITIDYVADQALGLNQAPAAGSEIIKAEQTRIFVRSVKIGGFAMQGVLNLNNQEADKPEWRATDGISELDFSEDIIFNDGRKDNREGTTNGAAKEENAVLNHNIVENTAATVPVTSFGDDKNPGVTATTVPLLEGTDGFFYVIPRNGGQGVDVEINYDVQTIDKNVAGKLADNATLGTLVEQVLSQSSIFGDNTDIEAGKQYEIHLHIGMTSIKIDAFVTDWDDSTPAANPTLPYNGGDAQADSGTDAIAVGDVFNCQTTTYTPAVDFTATVDSIARDSVFVTTTGLGTVPASYGLPKPASLNFPMTVTAKDLETGEQVQVKILGKATEESTDQNPEPQTAPTPENGYTLASSVVELKDAFVTATGAFYVKIWNGTAWVNETFCDDINDIDELPHADYYEYIEAQ